MVHSLVLYDKLFIFINSQRKLVGFIYCLIKLNLSWEYILNYPNECQQKNFLTLSACVTIFSC